MTKKKEDAPIVNAEIPLQQLMLDCKQDKYRMVSLTTRWAVEVQKRESQTSHQPDQLVSMALKDILTGKVTLEEIEKLPPAPKLERRIEVASVISDELAKRIAEEDIRSEKNAKAKKDEEPLEEEEEKE